MKNKGFTLVEMLAVIVLLSTVLLIAAPRMLGTINKSRVKSAKQSLKGFLDTIELKLTSDTYTTENKLKSGFYGVEELANYGIKFKGGIPTDGWIRVEKDSVTQYSVVINNRYVFTKDQFNETMKEGKVADDRVIYTTLYRDSDAITVNGRTIASNISGSKKFFMGDEEERNVFTKIPFDTRQECIDAAYAYLKTDSEMEESENVEVPSDDEIRAYANSQCVERDYKTPNLELTPDFTRFSGDHKVYLRHTINNLGIISETSLCFNAGGQLCLSTNNFNNTKDVLFNHFKFDENTWQKDDDNAYVSPINENLKIGINESNGMKLYGVSYKIGNSYSGDGYYFDINYYDMKNISFITINYNDNENDSNSKSCSIIKLGQLFASTCDESF